MLSWLPSDWPEAWLGFGSKLKLVIGGAVVERGGTSRGLDIEDGEGKDISACS
jgi:hypothetical protein